MNNQDAVKQVQNAYIEMQDLYSKTEPVKEKILTLEFHQRCNNLLLSDGCLWEWLWLLKESNEHNHQSYIFQQ